MLLKLHFLTLECMNQNQVSWLWITHVSPFWSNHQAFEVWLLKCSESNFLLITWDVRLTFPICHHWLSLGSWHNLFLGKERATLPLQEEGKNCSCFPFSEGCHVTIPCCGFSLCWSLNAGLLLLEQPTRRPVTRCHLSWAVGLASEDWCS